MTELSFLDEQTL